MVEGDVAPRVTTKANLCSFLPFFLYYARTKQGKKEKNNNNQFQQIKPNPCLSSHFRCCFSMQRVFIHYRTNVARAMHLSTTGFNALIGFGNCPGGTWKGHSTKSSQFGEGKTWGNIVFLEFLSRIHFFAFFLSRVMCFWMAKTGDLSTRTPSAINLPPVIASSERAFATSGSQGWARENDGRYPLNLP